ncbi:acyl-CoA dehydrogenase family protein [Nonomuraea sp. NPDC049480]|uniref:acyl-CoA dehydrogenase family protein n=1 Tax=Nonomuraea sp. NPDC049480 TaxID=3364353 RepID=UPI0037AB2895
MTDLPDLAQWRRQARDWLVSVLPRKDTARRAWGEGHPDFSVIRNLAEDEESTLLAAARGYQRLRYDAGYQAMTLPEEYGGRGLPSAYALAFAEEEAAFETPASTELISVTVGLVGHAVSMFGTDGQRSAYGRAFLRTDLLACQLFSEPGAGSDLAALSCGAVRDGDGWIVDGQKVWTSGAQFADYGLLLARTDPDVVKQAGITAFLVPMDAPGIEIRPIRQITGGAAFSEVFFTSVRVPDELRLGEPSEGWKVANGTLAFERTNSGAGTRRKGGTFEDVLELARSLGRTGDPIVRQRLADLYIRTVLRRATADRVARSTAAGRPPGPAASLGKLMGSELLTLTGDVAAEILGGRIAADTGEWGTFAWVEHLLGAPGYRIAGGTDQIQRNVIAERVLGLPPEPRVDRVPFSQLPRS